MLYTYYTATKKENYLQKYQYLNIIIDVYCRLITYHS